MSDNDSERPCEACGALAERLYDLAVSEHDSIEVCEDCVDDSGPVRRGVRGGGLLARRRL